MINKFDKAQPIEGLQPELAETLQRYLDMVGDWGSQALAESVCKAAGLHVRGARHKGEPQSEQEFLGMADFAVLNTLIEQMPSVQPGGSLIFERKQEEKRVTLEKQRLHTEVRGVMKLMQEIGKDAVPRIEHVKSAVLWLGLRTFTQLPEKNIDVEIKHPQGPVATVATGFVKSYVHQRPMLELHGTNCPSYLGREEWETIGASTGIYVHQQLDSKKVELLKRRTELLECFDSTFHDGLQIHTASPDDGGDFQAIDGYLNRESKVAHWAMMKTVEEQVPGLTVLPDLQYVRQFTTQADVDKMLLDEQMEGVYSVFSRSNFIQQAYVSWGIDPKPVFGGIYIGSVRAYGNQESAFNLQAPLPLKVYINLEEKDSPESFAGRRTDVDFRHLLKDQGYHLSLLTGIDSIRSPWAKKEKTQVDTISKLP